MNNYTTLHTFETKSSFDQVTILDAWKVTYFGIKLQEIALYHFQDFMLPVCPGVVPFGLL